MNQPAFNDLEILERRQETPDLTHLSLRAPADYVSAYTVPGQYVQIKHADLKPGFFALASGPGQAHFDLLIKKGSPLADELVARSAGQSLAVSLPQGKGYALNQAAGRDVLLVGVGSGLAPLRALIQHILAHRGDYKRVSLLYGARTPQALPYNSEMEAWKKQGIDVIRVCSQPPAGSWDGPACRVNQSLPKPIDPNTAVFACGMKPMVEDLKAALKDLGVPPERVFQNF